MKIKSNKLLRFDEVVERKNVFLRWIDGEIL